MKKVRKMNKMVIVMLLNIIMISALLIDDRHFAKASEGEEVVEQQLDETMPEETEVTVDEIATEEVEATVDEAITEVTSEMMVSEEPVTAEETAVEDVTEVMTTATQKYTVMFLNADGIAERTAEYAEGEQVELNGAYSTEPGGPQLSSFTMPNYNVVLYPVLSQVAEVSEVSETTEEVQVTELTEVAEVIEETASEETEATTLLMAAAPEEATEELEELAQAKSAGDLTITATGYHGIYDGNAHAGAVVCNHPEALIEYSPDGVNWQTSAPSITRVGEKVVYVRATLGDQKVETSYTMKVEAVDVVITSGSKTVSLKDLPDGILRDGTYTIDGPSGVPIEVKVTGVQEGVGSSENTIEISWKTVLRDCKEQVSDEGLYNIILKPGTLTVTDEPKPELTKVSVVKVWCDGDDKDGIRPASVTVNLLANGTKVNSIVLNKNNNWAHVFADLAKVDENGKAISYTVSEDEVADYETIIDGNMESGYVITNRHTPKPDPEPELTKVSVVKVWCDDNDKDGIRPQSVTVNLIANGTKVNSVVLSKSNNWTHTFDKLAKLDDSKKVINYTVSEDAVDGYTAAITGSLESGFVITNTHTPKAPEMITISGTKTWNDENNKDGIRPESIVIRLYANGKEVSNVKVSAPWTYRFENLPKLDGDKEIVYTISEDAVEGYSTTINGFNVTNTHTPKQEEKPVVPTQPTTPAPQQQQQQQVIINPAPQPVQPTPVVTPVTQPVQNPVVTPSSPVKFYKTGDENVRARLLTLLGISLVAEMLIFLYQTSRKRRVRI